MLVCVNPQLYFLWPWTEVFEQLKSFFFLTREVQKFENDLMTNEPR